MRSSAAERGPEAGGVVGGGEVVVAHAAKLGRQRGAAIAVALLPGQARGQVLGRLAVAARLEQPRQQLLGRLAGVEVGQRVVLARKHEPRLELEQRGDEDEELGRDLEVELAARLEVIEVADDDVGQLDLEQVDLLAENEREQQVERAAEDLEVQLELGDGHGRHGNERPGRQGGFPYRLATGAVWRPGRTAKIATAAETR